MFHPSPPKTSSKPSVSPQHLALAKHHYEILLKGVEVVKDYAIFILDTQGHVLTWNKGAEAIKGYKAEEIIGQSFSTFYKPEAIESHYPDYELKTAIEQGRFEDEGWRIRKDGTSFWANVVITAIFDEKNEHIGFVKVTRDLTERKLAEEKIKNLEKGIESIKDYAIFLLDRQGLIKSWNKGAELIKGYKAEEIIGQSFSTFYKPEAIESHYPEYELKTAIEQGRFEDEGWRIRKDGTSFWANVVITAIYDERNEHIGFIKVTRDLTERKQAERALAKRERDYRTLASIAPVGIFHCTPHGCLTYANEQACQFMGLSLEEAQGKGWLSAIHPEDREAVIRGWEDALKTKKTVTLEYRFYQPKKNKTIWVINHGRPELDEKEQIKSYVQTITNINKHKMLEEKELERLAMLEKIREEQDKRLEETENNQKRLKEFMDTICHEIRNPLNGMAGSADMLKETIAELKTLLQKHNRSLSFEIGNELTTIFDSLTDLHDSLNQSIQQQKLIVDDVLDYSKLEHSKLELKVAPFSPKSVILASVQIFSAQFHQKRIQLDLHLPEKETIVEGDAGRLKQVLINLLSNALKFTPKGIIQVSLSEHCLSENTVELVIEVKDTGVGMDKEQISQMFNRFTQFSSSSSSQPQSEVESASEGSGLGLSISQKLIEMMGGRIEVKSEKGQGTEITLKVPLPFSISSKLPQVSYPKPRSTAMTVLKKVIRKVLIVDDAVINQRVLIHYIKQLGWDFQTAEDGLIALGLSEDNLFDVIFMDIEMPVMNGLEATRRMRWREQERGQKPSIIIGISANAQEEQLKRAKEAGMDDYLTKPVHKVAMFNLLQVLLSRPNNTETLSTPALTSSFSCQDLPKAKILFFPTPEPAQSVLERLVVQFKSEAKELLAQQFPFRARCENECLIIELSSLTPYVCQLVLTQFGQIAERVLQAKGVKASVEDNHLRLITHTAEEAHELSIILSEAGLREAFNRPEAHAYQK
jgi:PAS domain S-box-containing protein